MADIGTQRLYYEDAYLTEFEAEVVEARQHEGRPAVVLDRTAFYPESGGQPWDTGTLGGAAVVEVLDLDGTILHVLDRGLEGGRVRGRIDWPARFDRMQQHTGQHVLSQAFWEVLKGETRSFHLGPGVSTLEIGLPSASDADLDKVEDRANAVVWEDRAVKTYFVPEERIGEVPLQTAAEEAGPAPHRRGRRLRLLRLRRDARPADGRDRARPARPRREDPGQPPLRFPVRRAGASGLPGEGPDRRGSWPGRSRARRPGVAAQVEKLGIEHKALKKRARKLEERLAAFEAGEVVRSAKGRVIAAVLEDRTPDEARFLALNIVKSGEFAVAYGAPGEGQGHLIVARSESIRADLRQLIPAVAAVLPVKGGGGPSLVELVTPETARLREAVDAAEAWLKASA